jgi:hypothetical protein
MTIPDEYGTGWASAIVVNRKGGSVDALLP